MPAELFANLPQTKVTSGGTDVPVSGTQETWTVASSASFPAPNPSSSPATQFHVADVAIGKNSEIIAVTVVSGTTWTVTRGAEGTAPVAHSAGFTVSQVITAGVFGGFLQGAQNLSDVASAASAVQNIGAANVYNVKSAVYGAAGNGITADDAAIQSAVNAAAAAGGGIVYLPAGTYKLTAGLVLTRPGVPNPLPASGVIIRGAGALTSVLRPVSGVSAITAPGSVSAGGIAVTGTNASPCVFTAGTGTAPGNGNGVRLSGASLPAGFTAGTTYYVTAASGAAFQLAASPGGTALASTSSGSGTLLQPGQVTQVTMEDFGITGPGQGTGTAPGMSLTWCTAGIRISRVYIQSCGGDGIYANNSYSVSLRDSFLAFNGGSGLDSQYNINNWAMSGNASLGNTRWGYYLMGGAGSSLCSCDAETNGYGGLGILGTFSYVVLGGEFENNGSAGSSGQQCGIYVGAGTAGSGYGPTQNATVLGNWVQGTSVAQYGIVVDGAYLTTIQGNGFQNNLADHILVTANATATLIGPGNYLSVPSGANISDSGTATQYLDYDTANHVMRTSGLSFGTVANPATATILPGAHPGQLVVSASAPTFGAVLRVTNTATGVGVPAMYVTATAQTDLAYGCAYSGAGFLPFQFQANGRTGWGPGTATVDTFLARARAGVLSVSNALALTIASQALAVSGTVTINAGAGGVQAITLSANATGSVITNPATGMELTIWWIQDSTGGWTYAWPANCKFAGGSAPAASSTAGYTDSVTFVYNGTNWVEKARATGVH